MSCAYKLGANSDTRSWLREKKLLNMHVVELCWLFLLNALLFQVYLNKYISAAGYLDETVTVSLLACSLFSINGRRAGRTRTLSNMERYGLFSLAIVVVIGLLGGYVSAVQLNYRPILIDIFACAKFPVALVSGMLIFQRKEDLFDILLGEIKLLLLIMIPFALINQFTDIGMRFDSRYGLYSFQFIFGHPASLTAVMAGFEILLLAESKDNKLWLGLCWLFMVFSLRSVAIAFAAFSFLVWLFCRNKGRIGVGQVAAFVPVSFYFGWSHIQYYFLEVDGSARRKLLDTGVEVANRFFPLGSGFATFGSNITSQREYYSKLYYEYGLSGVQGLSIQNANFLSDSFWPIVFGQFGWIGGSLYAVSLCLILLGVINRLRARGASSLPVVLAFCYLAMFSFSGSAFFHPCSVWLAVCISLAVCHQLNCGLNERQL